MRGAWVALLAVALACDASDEEDGPTIDLVVADTLDPLEDGTTYEVNLRPQGVYGGLVDLHIVGVPVDAVPGFGIAIETDDGIVFANQRYSTTSTGMLLEDGSFTIRQLPVVFADAATADEVDGQPAALIADIESEPPAQTRVDVTLTIVPSVAFRCGIAALLIHQVP